MPIHIDESTDSSEDEGPIPSLISPTEAYAPAARAQTYGSDFVLHAAPMSMEEASASSNASTRPGAQRASIQNVFEEDDMPESASGTPPDERRRHALMRTLMRDAGCDQDTAAQIIAEMDYNNLRKEHAVARARELQAEKDKQDKPAATADMSDPEEERLFTEVTARQRAYQRKHAGRTKHAVKPAAAAAKKRPMARRTLQPKMGSGIKRVIDFPEKAIMMVMYHTECDRDTALNALVASKGNATKAIEQIRKVIWRSLPPPSRKPRGGRGGGRGGGFGGGGASSAGLVASIAFADM